jgi:hypothetical protein
VKSFFRLSTSEEEEEEEEPQPYQHGRFHVSARNLTVEPSGREEEDISPQKQYRLKAVQVSSLITGDQHCLFFNEFFFISNVTESALFVMGFGWNYAASYEYYWRVQSFEMDGFR